MAELLLSTAVMTIMVGVTGTLAVAVREGWQHSQGQASVAQEARVALERIRRRVQSAKASPAHPGFGVISTLAGGYRFPDTLIVWCPGGSPVNPAGPPKVNECVFFCPNPQDPRQLLEITAPSDSRDLPLDSQLDTATVQNMVEGIKTAATSNIVVLTSLLRTASTSTSSGSSNTNLRGALRFVRELHPSTSEWAEYQAGTRSWNNLSFAQDWRGATVGLRQAWLKIEMQMVPPNIDAANAGSDQLVVGVIGSAALYYPLPR